MIYKLLTTEIEIDGKKFVTYGIEGENIRFEDVSTEKIKVSEMIERINREQLEECHLLEFIEDELIR